MPGAALAGVVVLTDGLMADSGAPAARDPLAPIQPMQEAPQIPYTGADVEAAQRYGWRLTARDEFDGVRLNTDRWFVYSGPTTNGVGTHSPDNVAHRDGELQITSRGKLSGGLAWQPGQSYGRWEVRARAEAAAGYGPVILLWPDAEDWPEGGEINFMEVPNDQRTVTNFVVHYGKDNDQVGATLEGDFTTWHNFAVEWTPDHIAGFVDGVEIYRTTDPLAVPSRPMHLAIQQDPGPLPGWISAPNEDTPDEVVFHIDWVRIYAP